MAFVSRVPDRGEPVTPIAFLLSHAHGFEPVNYHCKMLGHFVQSSSDLELRELFNVAWAPAAVVEGKPAAPDVQSLPSGVYGNIFDELVDRPAKARAIFRYPSKNTVHTWRPEGGKDQEVVPFEVASVALKGAKALAHAGKNEPLITRHAVGKGAVLVTLVPRMLGQDERAHPSLPWLLNGLTDRLLPIEVRRPGGGPLSGEIMYQMNKVRDGYLVLLVNNRGVDKTPNGVARVDRRKYVDVVLQARGPVVVASAKEMTQEKTLLVRKSGSDGGAEVSVRVHPGDVQVVHLKMKGK
jgi:hypothetical protein